MALPLGNTDLSDNKVLCYGNNKIPSSKFRGFYENHSEEMARDLPIRISLYYAPDLDQFNRFEDPVYTPEVRELILQRKIDVFLILISLEHVMSSSMYDLLTSVPTQLGLSEESFWKKTVIAFSMRERCEPKRYIQASIGRSVSLKKIVEKVEYRYTYVSESEPDAFWSNLLKHISPSLRITNEVVDVARFSARYLRSVETRRDEVTHPTGEPSWSDKWENLISVKNTLWRIMKENKVIVVSVLRATQASAAACTYKFYLILNIKTQ